MDFSHHILYEVDGYNVMDDLIYLVIEPRKNNECLHLKSVVIL